MPVSAGLGAGLSGFAEGFSNVFVQKHLQKKHAEADMHKFMLQAATKGEIPFDSPEVQKSAKAIFGKNSETFMKIGQTIAAHKLGVKNDFDALVVKHRGLNPGDDQKAYFDAIQEATETGKEIPPQASSEFVQAVMGPSIAAGKATAAEPIHVREAGEKKATTMGVEYSPEGTAMKAGAAQAVGAAGAAGRTSVTEPLARGREGRAAAREQAKEARAQEREMAKERRAQAAKVLAAAAIKWQNAKGENPPANLTVGEAVTQGYHPVDPKESGFLSMIGLGPAHKKVGAGTHYDPDQNAADKALLGLP